MARTTQGTLQQVVGQQLHLVQGAETLLCSLAVCQRLSTSSRTREPPLHLLRSRVARARVKQLRLTSRFSLAASGSRDRRVRAAKDTARGE